VSYDVAAVAEVLGGTASLVPIGDEDALARAVLELLESRDDDVRLRTRLARERFEEQYSVSRVAEATAHWYGRFDRRRSRA
jgi:glycosyltransferase involved in cell wall biosynthesis